MTTDSRPDSRLKIYRGLPGSGKTTLAELEAASYGDRLAGRDHIRRLLGYGSLGTPKQENEVTEFQERIIVNGIRSGQVVHVDDMNLRAKYVKRLISLADSLDVEYKIVDLTWVEPGLCAQRDAGRVNPVGRELINDLYRRFIQGYPYPLPVPASDIYGLKRVTPEPYVRPVGGVPGTLIDIDGTVALHEGIRGHHEYDKVSLDKPNAPVIWAVQASIARGLFPIFVSGRPDSCWEDTRMWIHKHVGVGAYELYMRQTGDHRPDWLVKLEIFDREIRPFYDIRMAWDDRDQVVRMYRDLGIPVFQVAPGNF